MWFFVYNNTFIEMYFIIMKIDVIIKNSYYNKIKLNNQSTN